MEKIIFTKTFELEKYQVLIEKEYRDESEEFVIKQTAHFEGFVPSMALIYYEEKHRDDFFEKYSEVDAENFIKSIQKLTDK